MVRWMRKGTAIEVTTTAAAARTSARITTLMLAAASYGSVSRRDLSPAPACGSVPRRFGPCRRPVELAVFCAARGLGLLSACSRRQSRRGGNVGRVDEHVVGAAAELNEFAHEAVDLRQRRRRAGGLVHQTLD